MVTLTVIGILLVIETVLTVFMMEQAVTFLMSIPIKPVRQFMYKMINNVFVAFLLDTAISAFMTAFTGSSIIAGTANLAASVLTAFYLPGRIERKFGHLVEDGSRVAQN